MNLWNTIKQLIFPSSARQNQYKEIRIPREGKEDSIFYGQHIEGDTVQGRDSCLEFQLYVKQTGQFILEIKPQDDDGMDHAALEFPNADEATKYMTKITENAQKDDLNIKAMMN
jgi:hypothetical protein